MSGPVAPARLDEATLVAFQETAVLLAGEAAAAILPLFRRESGLENKAGPGAFDPVTAADRGAEAAIRRALQARFPDHGVIGEEYGADRADAEFVWVLDPIDGTRGFIAGVPLWTTLIALRWRGRPVVGVIAQPYLGEVFVGSRLGSRLLHGGRQETLRVKPCPALRDAIVGATDPESHCGPDERAAFARVRAQAKLTRLGGDAYFFALAAAGTLDLVIEPAACKAWDIEAAIPLIEGAGGIATDWRGRPLGAEGGQIVVAGDRRVLDGALALLKPAAA